MSINPLKTLSFIAGGILAALAVAWFAGSLDGASDKDAVEVVEREEERASPKADRPVAPADDETGASRDRIAAVETEVVPPSFDILRVEPDGSILIAGQAAPGSTIEILTGSQAIGESQAGQGGDFVAVLDKPLKPGEYQIVLRSTTQDNIVAASPETAIVSIPEKDSGQVLALVEQPGEPSRLITVPEATPDDNATTGPAAGVQNDGSQPGSEQAGSDAPGDERADRQMPDRSAGARPGEGDEQDQVSAERGEGQPAERSAAAASADRQETPQGPRSQEADAGQDPAPQDGTTQVDPPAGRSVPSVDEERSSPADDFAGGEEAAGVAAPADRTEANENEGRPAGAGEPAPADEAARTAGPDASGTRPPASSAANEREASSPAGSAPALSGQNEPSAPVRQAPAASESDLAADTDPPGAASQDQVFAADRGGQAGDRGRDQEARAQADRDEPTDRAAASQRSGAAAPGQDGGDRSRSGAGAAGRSADETQMRPQQAARVAVEAVEIEGRQIFVAGIADAGSMVRVYANEILLGQAEGSEGGRFLIEAERDLPVGDYIIRADMLSGDGAVVARAAVPFEREAGEAIAAVAPSMAVEESSGDRRRDEEPEAGDAQPARNGPADPDEPSAADHDGQAQGGDRRDTGQASAARAEPAEVDAAEPPSENGQVGELAGPAVATAPRLEPVESAVIIRRGDNLWRISRRVYGRGVRFSTIYLANQNQIQDPDLIFPGQIFTVPEKTEQGETADLEAIGDRLVPAPHN